MTLSDIFDAIDELRQDAEFADKPDAYFEALDDLEVRLRDD